MNEERNRGEVSRARCGIVETRAREGEALRARDGQPRPLNPRGGRPPPAIPTETASFPRPRSALLCLAPLLAVDRSPWSSRAGARPPPRPTATSATAAPPATFRRTVRTPCIAICETTTEKQVIHAVSILSESRTHSCVSMTANPYPCNAYQSLGKMQVVLASIFMAH